MDGRFRKNSDRACFSRCNKIGVADLVREFSAAHARYRSERERFDAYSLWEVIARLKGEVPKYEDGFRALMLEVKLNPKSKAIFQK